MVEGRDTYLIRSGLLHYLDKKVWWLHFVK